MDNDTVNIIAEIKKASPSKGVILEDFQPLKIALEYEAGGASAISILTDEIFFKGKIDYIPSVRTFTTLPLLLMSIKLFKVGFMKLMQYC